MFDSRGLGYTPLETRTSFSPSLRVPRRSIGAGAGGTSGVTAPVNWGGLVDLGIDYLRDRYGRGGTGGGGSEPMSPQEICASRGLTYNPLAGGCNELVAGGTGAVTCPDGSFAVGGKCIDFGAALPGGDPFVSPASGASGIGPLGLYASPMVVGEINGRPIRRCPRGLVLARDEQCYDKRALPNRFRKHPKRRKAKISAYDWKMMRRYGPGGSKQERAKEFAQAAGYSVSHTAKSKPKKRGKKK